MSEAERIIASLYLPMRKQQLLLPNVSVAEVVGYQKPIKPDESPDYFLGYVKWRGVDIAVISFEEANGQTAIRKAKNARIAVINTIGKHHAIFPFFAIVTQGIPRLIKINNELIKTVDAGKGKAETAVVRVDGEDAVIPDIEYLESLAYQQL